MSSQCRINSFSRKSPTCKRSLRKAHEYDHLAVRYSDSQIIQMELEKKILELASRLEEQVRANDRLQSALIARAESRVRMVETYEGVVEHVHGDTVVVVYDVSGKIIEQTYERNQFLEGRLPEVDTPLVVYVTVAQTEPPTGVFENMEDGHRDEQFVSRRRPLTGPTAF